MLADAAAATFYTRAHLLMCVQMLRALGNMSTVMLLECEDPFVN